MDKFLLLTVLALCCTACASQKKQGSIDRPGDSRTRQLSYMDDNTYFLEELSEEESYGYQESNPVKVGGAKENAGPKNERRFLNALSGPNGEELKYFRAGSCCPFKTPNGLLGNTGLLDRYRVYWEGSKDTLDIYINMYDEGDLKIPVGLNGRKR